MESIFKFQDGMDIDPSDFNSLETFAQQGLDHVVGDAIGIGSYYAGMTISKTGTTTAAIDVGRLYAGGYRYALNAITQQDFLAKLPGAGTLIVLVVVNGTEADSNVVPREFLLDETTGASEPRAVATQHDRICNLSFVYGIASPNPVAPIVSAAYTIVGQIVLGTAGIVSVSNNTNTDLANLTDVNNRLGVVEAFDAAIAPQISTLASDVARLSNQANAPSPTTVLIGQMLNRIAILEAKAGVPSTAQSSAADLFLDTTTSDVTNPLYLAMIEEGIRYAYNAQSQIPIGLFNPNDPAAKVVNGVIFPAFTRSPRLTVGPAIADVQISAYSYATTTLVQKSIARTRIRYGTSFNVCTNSAFWHTGTYNASTGVFTRAGETFNVNFTGQSWMGQTAHEYLRLTQFWTDTYSDPYWDAVTTNNVVSGAQVAETFLCGQDFWLESVALTFTFIDTTGPVTVALCETTDEGTPNRSKVITQATLAQNQLAITPAATTFAWTPAYLQAGRRYAIVVITTGNHKIATAAGTSFTQGTFFTLTGGGFAAGDLTRHLAFTLNSCKFTNPTTTLTLNPITLAGGIVDIDILTGLIASASTQVTFSVLVNGVWIILNASNVGQITAGGTLQALMQFRVTMLGTPDIMPAIDTTQSVVTASRPNTSLTHYSTPRTPPTSSANITITERYENWNATYHTAAVKIASGAGYTTETAATSFTDVAGTDGSIERTYVFALGGSPVSSYKIKTTCTTSTALICQHVAYRKDYCL